MTLLNIDWMPLITAISVGLMGSIHCIGMCGGVSSALSLAADKSKTQQYIVLYNLGRISSYTTAGMIVGILSQSIASLTNFHLIFLRVISSLLIIVMALHIGGFWSGVKHVERLGKHLWKILQPLNKKIFPVNSKTKALSYGLLWGWLPCGLVYTTLGIAMTSGSVAYSTATMFFFGLGTLPSMLAVGLGVGALQESLKKPLVRQTLGVCLLLWGIYQLAIVLRSIVN